MKNKHEPLQGPFFKILCSDSLSTNSSSCILGQVDWVIMGLLSPCVQYETCFTRVPISKSTFEKTHSLLQTFVVTYLPFGLLTCEKLAQGHEIEAESKNLKLVCLIARYFFY